MLVIFGGLPGTGKTTLAKALAKEVGAVYVRIDTIETAIKNSLLHPEEVIDAGYLVGYGLAKDNLALGHTVIADSVNSIDITRQGWQEVASSSNVPAIEVEIICSDATEHQYRVENRGSDLKGHTLPSWDAVRQREYQLWETADVVIDTVKYSIPSAVETLKKLIINYS